MNPQPPMSRGLELTSELLTAQGRALRALARSLLRDPHAAEDVVQDTWLTCLRHGGALPVRVSAWLGTVARRLALRRVRGEGRRTTRERGAAVPERVEDAVQRSLEREEALRAVTQALLALEEPFKTALLLRYYGDKTPGAIAEELGLPLPTVKSRLARGLERLRAKLGAEFRGDESSRRRGLAALAGLGAPALVTTGGAAAGGLALGFQLWVCAAALIVAGVGLAWWSALPGTQGTVARPLRASGKGSTGAVAGRDPLGGVPSRAAAAGKEAGQGREAAPLQEASSWPSESFPPEASLRYRIAGRVRDERDQPRGGVGVYLAPRLFPFNRVATTDGDGRFTLEFDARRATLDATLGFAMDGLELGLREVHLVAGLELDVDVGLQATAVVRIGENLVTVELGAHESELVYSLPDAPRAAVEQAGLVLATRLRVQGALEALLEGAPEWLRRPDGRGLFVDPLLNRACARSAEGALELELSAMASERIALAGLYPLALTAAVHLVPVAATSLRGVVRNARGEPVPHAEAGWRIPGDGRIARVRSDGNGAFVLTEVPTGPLELTAGGGDEGVATERVVLEPEREFTWNPVLDRGAEVSGRLITDEGEPLAGQRVELWSASSSTLWCDSTRTDEEGCFALPNVPSGSFELCIYLADSGGPFPAKVLAPVFPGAELGTVQVGRAERAGRPLVVRLLAADEARLPGAELRVRQDATGLVALGSGPGEDGSFAIAHLPGGTHRVEAGGPLGWRDLGTIWIEPGVEGPLDLGTERFPRPGFVRVETPERGGSLSLWSTHPDVFGHVTEVDSTRPSPLALCPGEYVLCARHRGARGETPFTVSTGEGTALALEESPAGLAARPRPFAPDALATETRSCGACHATAESAEGVELGGPLFGGF